MGKINLKKYTNDDGELVNNDDAAYVRDRVIKPGDTFDFSGVRRVTREVLNTLFGPLSVTELADRIDGADGQVADEIMAWLDRPLAGTKASAGKAEAPPIKALTKRPSVPPPARFVRDVEASERFTPSRLAERLRRQLRSYIESAYPLSDPALIEGRRALLEQSDGGHLLAQEPFVETTPRYPESKQGYLELGLSAGVGEFLDGLTRTPTDHEPDRSVLYPRLYEHQARAFRSFLNDGRDLVVATGTGSGKTECFLVPLAASLYDEAQKRPASFARRGVRVLILYPMNALVNDQLARLRQLLGSTQVAEQFRALGAGRRHPVFGMYTSRTPYPGPRDGSKDGDQVAPLLETLLELEPGLREQLARRGRLPAKDLEAFLAREQTGKGVYQSGKKKGETFTKHHWERRLLTSPQDRELLTRQEMVHDSETDQGQAPDVLVTNYSMLEYMLMRPFERPLFEQTRAWLEQPGSQFLLVLDEAHMYRGARGAEVAFLVRRLLARLGLTGRPEKFRAILTSASLGDKDAEEVARRFAADLTSKPAASFDVIQGRRAQPAHKGPGTAALAGILGALDLEKLHERSGAHTLAGLLGPIFVHLGAQVPGQTEDATLAALHRALSPLPVVGKLLEMTAGRAVPLGHLARELFGDHAQAERATEVLLALGTLARLAPGEPGLLPTRVHLMFRGFEGLYACIDPRCAHDGRGALEKPNPSGLGKLFIRPQTSCDVCGGRVFEVMSCRECGTAYLEAYTPKGTISKLDFLWNEVEGELDAVQVLPVPPRTAVWAEQVAVQLSTGQMMNATLQGQRGLRPIWLARNTGSGAREAEFPRCAMCQPESSRRNTRITDLRTRGEQAFAALLDAQFAEQPPMDKVRKDLANQGRKVLVFSDGRQKAARLAPALETSHQSDVFRQVLVLALRALAEAGEPTRLSLVYPALLWVCHTRGIELYPTLTDEEGVERPDDTFRQHLHMAEHHAALKPLLDMFKGGELQPPLAYGRSLYEALTDRFLSVWAMGLATVEEEKNYDFIFSSFPEVGLTREEQHQLYRAWIQVQLEEGNFWPPGATVEKVTSLYDRPNGIDATNPRFVTPERFEQFLRRELGSDPAVAQVRDWFVSTLKKACHFLNDRYYLRADALALQLRLDEGWSRCPGCGKLHLDPLRWRCHGCLATIPAESAELYLEAKFGYYRDQVRRALRQQGLEPFGLVVAEHSAQLSGLSDGDVFSRTELHELRFQDVRVEGLPPIDVLSCTTTMEVGIDIGSLAAVALRNVPPHVANYQQRAGRAGRRGLVVASVVTYAHGGTHDAHYFREPEDIIAGPVRIPIVYTENLRILRRHVQAYMVQRFVHEQVGSKDKNYHLFASMGSVGDFLSEQHPCSYQRLRGWLVANERQLSEELRRWVPDFCHGFQQPIDPNPLLARAVPGLLDELQDVLPLDAYSRRDVLPPAEREVLESVLADNLLELLVRRAVFPRYAFPIDTVTFWVPSVARKKGGAPGPKFDYQPQRDLQIALSEYAPGRTLTIDKWRFTSAALYSPYVAQVSSLIEQARAYTACKTCGYVSLEPGEHARDTCPCCGGQSLFKKPLVRPDGFAPDVNKPREKDRGGTTPLAMRSTPARLELAQIDTWDEERLEGRLRLLVGSRRLVSVNKGVGDRGFHVCRECGLAEPVVGPGFTKSQLMSKNKPSKHISPVSAGRACQGAVAGPLFLGHEFQSDVLLMRLRMEAPMSLFLGENEHRSGQGARVALTSLVETLVLAASRTLQIDEGELAGNWSPALGEGDLGADVYLYDVLPGGAGYTRQIREHLDEVLAAAERLVSGCVCASSCYECLRHYNNQIHHSALDRHLALSLLRWLRDGSIPSLSPEQRRRALGPLSELLRLRGLPVELDVVAGPETIPLRVVLANVETWVDVHHPLINPEQQPSSVQTRAMQRMQPCVALDAYRLEHALPAAERHLMAHTGAG